jgi:hypothetical protein
LDWRKQQGTRAAVRVAVEETLDRLAQAFTRQLYSKKCDAVYQHVFDSYWDDGRSVTTRSHRPRDGRQSMTCREMVAASNRTFGW